MSFESLGLSLVIVFMVLGLIGTVVPLMPGTLLMWLAALAYALATGFTGISPGMFALITGITLVTATSDIWLSLLGAKIGGAGRESFLWGTGGALAGFVLFNLLGALIGYALGILYSEYRKHGNWHAAFKASLGGIAGWGLSTVLQAVGGLAIFILFIWEVVSKSH